MGEEGCYGQMQATLLHLAGPAPGPARAPISTLAPKLWAARQTPAYINGPRSGTATACPLRSAGGNRYNLGDSTVLVPGGNSWHRVALRLLDQGVRLSFVNKYVWQLRSRICPQKSIRPKRTFKINIFLKKMDRLFGLTLFVYMGAGPLRRTRSWSFMKAWTVSITHYTLRVHF